MPVFMMSRKVLTFYIVFLLIFSVQNSFAVEDDESDDKGPYFDFSVFQDKDKYEEWKAEQIRTFERSIRKIQQIDTEDKYVEWFNGYFPPCEMGVWKEHMINSYKIHIKKIKSLEFRPVISNRNNVIDRTSRDFVEAYKNGKLVNGKFPEDEPVLDDSTKSNENIKINSDEGNSEESKPSLPRCLQGEYSYKKFNTLYDPRIHNVTNHRYRNSDYNANITAVVVPEPNTAKIESLEVDVSEEGNEPIILNQESAIEKREKSFLKRLIDKIRDYIWAKH